MSLTIRTHTSAPATYISGVNITVGGGGGEVTLVDLIELRQASERGERLVELATDNAFGAGQSTLVLLSGGDTVAPGDVQSVVLGLAERLEETAAPAPIELLMVTDEGGLMYDSSGRLLLTDER